MMNEFPIASKVRIKNILQTFDKKGRENKYSRDVYYVIGRENYQFVLMDEDGNVLKDYYPAHMLLRVDDVDDGTLVEKEKIATEKKVVKKRQTLNRLQRKEVAIGHEAEKIDDKGQIVFKERLQPKDKQRIRKKTTRMDL